METGNRLTAARGKGVVWWKKGEKNSQRTCMKGPWAWTTVWGLTMGVGWVEDGKGRKTGTAVIE